MTRLRLVFAMLAAVVMLSGGCQAPSRDLEQSVKPGINEHYENADVEVWTRRFESEDREIFRHRREIIDAVGAKRGMTVADVGAGTGFFTLMFADVVGPQGKVIAVEITPEFLDSIRTLARDADLSNVETVLCTERSVELPPESVDLMFCCDVYHHLEYPRSTMKTVFAALRPGGQLIVIDFDRVEGQSREWIMGHVRAGREEVIAEIRGDGFEFVGDVSAPYLEENRFLRFKKPVR